MRRALLLPLAATLLLSSCRTGTDASAGPGDRAPTNGIRAGTLEVKAARPNLVLSNQTEHVAGYMVIDIDQAVIALYPPCGRQCPTLAQGEQVLVPYTQIGGYTAASREANVLWFTYRRQADGTLVPEGGVQTTRVRL